MVRNNTGISRSLVINALALSINSKFVFMSNNTNADIRLKKNMKWQVP